MKDAVKPHLVTHAMGAIFRFTFRGRIGKVVTTVPEDDLLQGINYGSFNGIDMKRCYINVRASQLSGRCAHLILSMTGTFLLPSFQVMEKP